MRSLCDDNWLLGGLGVPLGPLILPFPTSGSQSLHHALHCLRIILWPVKVVISPLWGGVIPLLFSSTGLSLRWRAMDHLQQVLLRSHRSPSSTILVGASPFVLFILWLLLLLLLRLISSSSTRPFLIRGLLFHVMDARVKFFSLKF